MAAFNSKFVLTPPPFAVQPVTLGWTYDLKLQNRLREYMDASRLQQLGIAMVDLTSSGPDGTSGGRFSYAGYNDERQIFAGSLPKIAIMLASFRLREQVRDAARVLGIGDARKLFVELAKAWPGPIGREAQGRTSAFPRLAEIFDVRWDARKAIFSPDFQYELERMIERVGKNSAASYCAQRLGFAYINGVLQTEGLQFGRMGGRGFSGLSLSLDYGGNAWGSDGAATAQGASAKAVAAFLTALQTRQLVSTEASNEMIVHMQLASSWFKDGLAAAKRSPQKMFTKIGVAGTWSEGAVIERRPDILYMRYAAVVLGAPSFKLLWDAVVNIDSVMAEKY